MGPEFESQSFRSAYKADGAVKITNETYVSLEAVPVSILGFSGVCISRYKRKKTSFMSRRAEIRLWLHKVNPKALILRLWVKLDLDIIKLELKGI